MDASQAYREEAYELLAELESSLLELEENPNDSELIGRVFRAMHTIKGSGAMFGFDDIAEFTHEVETAFDLVRDGKIAVTTQLVNLSLSARDQIKVMLDASDGGEKVDESVSKEIISSFRKLISGNDELDEITEKPVAAPLISDNDSNTSDQNITYRIRFRPALDLFANGTNPILLLNELREIGDCSIVAQTNKIPLLEDFDAESCYTYWDIILSSSRGIDTIKDVFIFVDDICEIIIDVIDEEDRADKKEGYRKVGEILMERGDVSSHELSQALTGQKRIGEVLVEEKVVDQGVVESALVEQQHVQNVREKRKEIAQVSSIRVAADKLDNLVNLVGELVTVQARLTQKSSSQNDAELLAISEEVERLTGELRDNTMSIRMLPIGTTFNKFKRLVRDLSNELGKEVNMTTEGGETELDKTVLERLNDPLVHIIRNSIDHGIESPEARKAAEKPAQGTVCLSAEHSGANVLIQISDDGAGLDAEAIRESAIEKGLIAPDDEQRNEKEIFAFIFASGFSTAKEVTGVSGRGVGMDVVRRHIESLRGTIDIESEKGIGTTITLKLPLTLAIIDGLLVKIGREYYVVPLSAVEECVELTREDSVKAQNRNMMNLRGEIVPYLSLRELFVVDDEPPEIEQVVVAEVKGERVCFGVDHVIGQHQTVIKALGKIYKDIEGVSGATILGDGTVALILDVTQIVQSVEGKELLTAN
ncbi:two-component system, chemotaxis family, sensor kinase CheA [Candidatus Magnetomoraceae bacterium gMMP-15]